MAEAHRQLLRHYEACLERFGDTARGAGLHDEGERQARVSALLELLAQDPAPRVSLLDVGCGTGELRRSIGVLQRPSVAYCGVDASERALGYARRKFPDGDFRQLDILEADDSALAGLAADYCVVGGLFSQKGALSDAEMWAFMSAVLERLWPLARRAILFDIVAKPGERERPERFCVSLDRLAEFLGGLAGHGGSFHGGRGPGEYICWLPKEPPPAPPAAPRRSDAGLVCRPLLPEARHIARHLDRLDRRRWYSNFGETAAELTARLAAYCGLDGGQCVTASSGTDAITAALIAVAGRAAADRPYCLMPSYTFVGTAAAALNAGYHPYFLDIDAASWALDPERLLGHPMLERAGAVVVVAPYGRPVAQPPWERFSAATGVPVVIDAAAGLDAIAANPTATLGTLPVTLSLHATKVLGVGEGGLVLCRDPELIRDCLRALNFGFLGSREAVVAGFNGKMSEYHAAVGLAALEAWPRTRAGFLEVARSYREAARCRGLAGSILAETEWASGYVLYRAPSPADADAAKRRLAAAGVDFRLWYGLGCHRQAAYAGYARDPLPVTDAVAPSLIGLPVAVDLSEAAVERTIAALAGSDGR